MTRGAPGVTRTRRLSNGAKLTEEIPLVASAEQKARWSRIAASAGMSLSEFMRQGADVLGPMLEEGEVIPLASAQAIEVHFLELADALEAQAADCRRRAAAVVGRARAAANDARA